MIFVVLPKFSYAGESLPDTCNMFKGLMVNNQKIQNYNISRGLSLISQKTNLLSVLYNGVWYKTHSESMPVFLMMIQFGVTMDRKVNLCVSSIAGESSGDRELLGIEFSEKF